MFYHYHDNLGYQGILELITNSTTIHTITIRAGREIFNPTNFLSCSSYYANR
jgi:hypothetical protein